MQNTKTESEGVRKRSIKVSPQVLDKIAVEYQRTQDRFLSLLLMRPTLREFLSEHVSSEMLPTKDGKELFKYLKTHPNFDIKNIGEVQTLADYVKIESLLYEELYHGLELNELHDEAARLQADLVTKFVKIEKEKLSRAQRETKNEVELRSLQEKDRYFNLLLNQVKGAAHG